MPIKLEVGVSRKIGQPDYGSLGASCHLEIELDAHLLQHDRERFQSHVRQAYSACRLAVEEELARSPTNDSDGVLPPAHTAANHSAGVNGHATNGHGHNRSSPNKPANHASQKQLDYAEQLAGQIAGLGTRRMEALAQKLFDKPLAALSSFDASSLIDTLKQIKAGKLDLAAALPGVAV